MKELLLIGLGGSIGAVLRFLLGGWIQRFSASFPLGTLFVNFTGSLALGFIMYSSMNQGGLGSDARTFLAIGVLGAYTTMSTFSYESLRLLEQNQINLFMLNVFGTVLLMLFAVYLGRLIALNI